MTLFLAPPHKQPSLAKNLKAGRKTEEFVAGIRRNNHWFDALCNASAAGHLAGARLIDAPHQGQRRIFGKLSDMAQRKHEERRWFSQQRRGGIR